MSRRQAYLIAYDIADPGRLQRVCRAVAKCGIRVQYSVFFGEFTAPELDELMQELRSLVDVRRDDIRIYPLPRNPTVIWLGRGSWPDGVHFSGGGLEFVR